MTSPPTLASLSDADKEIIAKCLNARDEASESSPVYIQALTAIGGWVAATLLVAAWSSFFLNTSENISFVLPGIIGVVGGLILRVKSQNAFLIQMGSGLLVAGQLSLAFGASDGGRFAYLMAAVSAGVCLLTLWAERRRYTVPVTASIALAFTAYALASTISAPGLDQLFFSTLCTCLALVALFVRPKAVRIEYVGLASLLILIMYAEFMALNFTAAQIVLEESGKDTPLLVVWGGRIPVWLGALCALAWAKDILDRKILWATAAASTLLMLLLPFGATAALFLLLLGILIGWRPAALMGVLAAGWTISHFYYDLSLTLLAKSGLLVAAGVSMLLFAYLISRIQSKEKAS